MTNITIILLGLLFGAILGVTAGYLVASSAPQTEWELQK